MFFKRKYSCLLILIVLFCSYPFVIFGQEYSTIKVGLESIYNNAGSITLSSDGALAIGYYDANGFSQLGTLPVNSITIQKAQSTYRDTGVSYNTYDEAYKAAQSTLGVPVYVDENLFKVYSETSSIDEAQTVATQNISYVVKDAKNNVLFMFNKGNKDLVFRGYDMSTGMYLTKVGATKKYRGAIGMGGTTGITPYNVVEMEQYLYGVIPGEMTPSWPKEALKAQAVAARSIAIYQYNRHTAKGYNVVDTTTTQVYGGYLKEDARTNEAVDATKGQTLQYKGKVAEALYFSTSGGQTESAVNVWGSEIPYLVSVKDRYEEPEQAPWTRQMTLAEINNCLKSQGINIGQAKGVKIVSRTDSGRVKEMQILGANGNYSLTLEKIRTFFSSSKGGSLKSRLFSFSQGGIGQGNPQSQKVTVLSASGKSQLDTASLAVTNGTGVQKLTGTVSVQTGSGLSKMTLTNNTTGSTWTGSEVVWGDFTIYGEGFGHGVGMSQSGAKGMANAGYNYIEILQHYYTGVTVK